ncbi:uncharacterized protein LOC142986590 [Anticarsia gemmatalis]|uniref:uncharacterized protein LOC142986590 n=1 Tax=Anticarsia gemmatalis TaxID=129554 RepID=UPI003F775ED9
MLILGLLLSYITAALTNSEPDTNANNTYVLATVLFYKNADGKMVVAKGPVSSQTEEAIKTDLASRLNHTNIQVVPIFNETKPIPKPEDILRYVKSEFDTVFVTEAPQRLTRNIIKDWWDTVFHPHKRQGKRKRARTTTESVTEPSNSTTVAINLGHSVDLRIASNRSTTITVLTTTKKPKRTKTTKKSKTKTKLPRKREEFIPNDIYYGIEKKCVNWYDKCNIRMTQVRPWQGYDHLHLDP